MTSEELAALKIRLEALPEDESMRGWLLTMSEAVQVSLSCGLEMQAQALWARLEDVLRRAEKRESDRQEKAAVRIDAAWTPLPSRADELRSRISRDLARGIYALPASESAVILRDLMKMDEQALWDLRGRLFRRRTRWLRVRRRPWNCPRPHAEGVTVGLYNNQGVTADVLETAAKVAPLWVDDLLELERQLFSVDGLLGLAK